MAKLAHELAVNIRGKVGPLVYQSVRKGKGNIPLDGPQDLQVRRHVPQTDARTPDQLRGRARIAAATAAYQGLSAGEREAWKRAASGTPATGFNCFVADFCRRHPLAEY